MKIERSLLIAATLSLFLMACEEERVNTEIEKEYSQSRKESTFTEPDIKDAFCGVSIQFQYCKCAFHNDYCDDIGMNKGSANAYVQSEYKKYIDDLREKFDTACIAKNGYINGKTCYLCDAPATVEGTKCLMPAEEEDVDAIAEEENTPKEDCEDLEKDWEKYSDFDFRIPVSDRSFEAKEYARVQTELVDVYAMQAELVYETELLRGQLSYMRDYKAALVDNLRDNLAKATLRLAYTTYSQVKGAKGAGESLSKFLTSTKSIEALGAGMKTIQAIIPPDSRLAVDTTTAGGKVQSIGWNATLEAIESMGDPSKIAQQVMKDAQGVVVPSADITPEEVEILRVQNLENNLLDDAIAEVEAEIADNEAWLDVADLSIQELQAEAAKWSASEKSRVILMLADECE